MSIAFRLQKGHFFELASISPGAITPRFSLLFGSDTVAAEDLLKSLDSRLGYSATLHLYVELARLTPGDVIDATGTQLPKTRASAYTALLAESGGEYDQAIESYGSVWENGEASRLDHAEALGGLFRCLMRTGRFDESVRLMADAFVSYPGYLVNIWLTGLVDQWSFHCEDDPSLILDWIIVHHISQKQRTVTRDPFRLYEMHECFLCAIGVDRPSAVTTRPTDWDTRKMVIFLEEICVLDVLDSSITYRSSREVEEQRIQILQILQDLNPPKSDEYSAEIARLKHKAFIRRGIEQFEDAKIYVDIDGLLKSVLDSAFRQKFQRYLDVSGMPEELRKTYLADSHFAVTSDTNNRERDYPSGAFQRTIQTSS